MKKYLALALVALAMAFAVTTVSGTPPGDIMGPPQFPGGTGITDSTITLANLSATGRGIGRDGSLLSGMSHRTSSVS